MPELVNLTNSNEIRESMNFESERHKSKKIKEERKVKKKKGFEGLVKKFFHFKINVKIPRMEDKKNRKKKILFEEERLNIWNDITKKESKDFHKMDRLAKYKLAKIIPNEISKKR